MPRPSPRSTGCPSTANTAQYSPLTLVAAIALLWLPALLQAQAATEQFADQYGLIYQIRDVASSASSKSSIGSGFQVSANGLIVTNFHVVSGFVNAPESRRIEYLDQDGNSGTLELLDFDVVNDLAVLRHPAPRAEHFALASEPLIKGSLIYALGNPRDLGITLVFGANNGMVEHSYDPQILFSGSLNPGMSGGPGLNANGEVVGVNVATAGSQLSFLVPLEALQSLLDSGRTLDADDFDSEITAQIKAWQSKRFASLLALEWPLKRLGEHQVLGELRDDFQCWGDSNEADKDANLRNQRTSCTSGNSLFLGSRLNTGQIHYSFDNQIALDLSDYRFHAAIGSHRVSADNAAGKDDVTPYQCDNRFLDGPADTQRYTKVSYCVRGYKHLSGLYDVLFLGEHSAADRSLTAHYTLAGVEQDQADQFAERFLRELGWN
ncbi:MAG: S1C family serine protease [Pseudomonadales bacterium]